MAYSPTFTNPEGLSPNAFSDLAGGVHSQAVFTPYDFYTPQELTQLFEQHNYDVSYKLMLKALGFSRGVKAPTTGHFEAPWKTDHFHAGAIITPSAGAGTNVVVEVNAASMFTQTVGGAPVRGSYPRVWDIIHFPGRQNAQIVAKDTSTNPHRLTLRPLDATVDLAGLIVPGSRYFISTNAKAEGQTLPVGRQSRVTKYTNTFQIVSEKVSSTGTELTNQTYFDPIEGQPGSFFLKGLEDTMFRFEQECDGALMFGQQIDNINQTPNRLGFSVPVQGTEGLIEFATNYGYTDTYVPGLYAMQNIDDVTAIYDRERVGGNELMVWQGFKIFQEVENMLSDWVKQTDVQFTERTRDKLGVRIGFYGIEKSGYKIMFKKLPIFTDVKGAGTTGYDYPNWQIFTPIGYTKDKGDGTSKPTLGYEYKELNGYSRENVVIKLDGTGYHPVQAHEDDVYDCGLFGEIAAHNTCANAIVIQRP